MPFRGSLSYFFVLVLLSMGASGQYLHRHEISIYICLVHPMISIGQDEDLIRANVRKLSMT